MWLCGGEPLDSPEGPDGDARLPDDALGVHLLERLRPDGGGVPGLPLVLNRWTQLTAAAVRPTNTTHHLCSSPSGDISSVGRPGTGYGEPGQNNFLFTEVQLEAEHLVDDAVAAAGLAPVYQPPADGPLEEAAAAVAGEDAVVLAGAGVATHAAHQTQPRLAVEHWRSALHPD